MTIDTKYDIGQEVWFMYKNECINMKIEDIRIRAKTLHIQYFFNQNDIWLSQKHLFPTKDKLLKSL